jgi:UDP-2-acetamido-2-deoxy-ribo-hexuluronate aminotransferase
MISYDGWDRDYKENRDEYLKIFDRFMSQNNYENVETYENQFAEQIGRKYVVSVASATDALHFALLSYGIGPGDEVLVTDFSWISSASCISIAGAIPVFCDVDLDSYHISLDSIKRMYSSKTKALIYVHLFGNMTNTTEIENFCEEKGIAFIEDAAQSFGSSLNGIKAGTIGNCSVYSFNSNKVIAGINGGGVFMTDNKYLTDQVRKLRRHGKSQDFETIGYNSKLYVLNAEIINFRLKNLEKNQSKRQEIAKKYNQAFQNLPIYFQKNPQSLNHNYHKYTLRFKDKETRKRIKNAINGSIHYEKPLSTNSLYNLIDFKKDVCVNSQIIADSILSIPIHAWLTNDETDTIINKVIGHLND